MGKTSAERVPWSAILTRRHAAPLALVCLGIWLHAADELVIATMMAAIVDDIGGADFIAWTLALYELGSIIAGASSALLSLRFGVRGPMGAAALIFCSGCALAALAQSMPILLVGRLLQGLGGGGLVALAFVAVGLFFPRHLTARVMAAMSALWGTSAFLGPLIGGLFVEYGSWRGAFWFFGVQAALLAVWIATRRQGGQPAEGDIKAIGFPGLRLGFLAGAILLISTAGVTGAAEQVTALILAGVLALVGFLWLDARSGEQRLLPRQTMRVTRPVGAGLAMVFFMSVATIPLSIYGPLLIISIHDSSALMAGYIIACSSFGWTVFAIAVSGMPERNDPVLILIGMILVTLSIVGFVFAVPNGPLWLIALFATLEGGGFGIAWTFILRRARQLAGPGEIERISGALPTVQRSGYAVGAAFAGIIANFAGLGDGRDAATASAASTAIFVACLPLALLALVAALVFVRPAQKASVT